MPAVYDGASAAAEAVLMSRRIQPLSRRRVLMSRALHPQYRAVVASYLKNLNDVRLEEIPFDATGATDVEELARATERSSDVRAGRLSEFFRRDRRPGADPSRMRQSRRATDLRDDGSARARPAQAAGRIRRRYRGRRGTEFGRADESRRPGFRFFCLSEKICPQHSRTPCRRDRR